MGIKLNRSDLANHLGVSLPTVDRWGKDGMPVDQRGGRGVEWTFDLADVIRWRVDRARAEASGDVVADETELKRRKLAAETALSELELAKAKGDVAPIREFERAQSKAFAEIRQNVMNVPQRVVVQLLGCTDETEFKTKLRAELTLALEAAANAELILSEDDEEEPAPV